MFLTRDCVIDWIRGQISKISLYIASNIILKRNLCIIRNDITRMNICELDIIADNSFMDRSNFILGNQFPIGTTKEEEVRNLIETYNQEFIKHNLIPVGEINYDQDIAAFLFLKKHFNIQTITAYLQDPIQQMIKFLASKNN